MALVLCEVILRVVYDDKFGKRPRFIIADEELGWRPNAGLDHTFYGADFKIDIHSDDDGYRLGRLGQIDYGKELTILCGDSYVFGWGVPTEETMASYLDECVDRVSGGSRRVVNLGVGGYGTLQYYFRLANFLKAHDSSRISTVIIIHSPNDATDNLKSLGYHIGAWEVRNREEPERSPVHLLNFDQQLIYPITVAQWNHRAVNSDLPPVGECELMLPFGERLAALL